jgi:hypothetical protein
VAVMRCWRCQRRVGMWMRAGYGSPDDPPIREPLDGALDPRLIAALLPTWFMGPFTARHDVPEGRVLCPRCAGEMYRACLAEGRTLTMRSETNTRIMVSPAWTRMDRDAS